MHILVVSEGASEEDALPTLVRRVCGEQVRTEFRKVTDQRIPRVHGSGKNFFKKTLGCVEMAKREGFDALVFVIDRDGDRNRTRQLDEAQNYVTNINLPRACGVAVEAFDAWFLADEQAISQVLHSIQQRLADPESYKYPKAICREILENAGAALGLREYYACLAEVAKIDVIANRCPQGFAPLLERMKQLRNPPAR